MRRSWMLAWALVAPFLFCATGNAQSRLNFPIVLSGSDLPTTGIALVNTSSSPVLAGLNFYGIDGQTIVNQYPFIIPAGGQIARLASEMIPRTSASGWIQIVSPSAEVQGFELVGNFSTILDGAGPAVEGKQFVAIHFSRDDVLHVVNPGPAAGTVRITLNDTMGGALGSKSVPLSPLQPATVNMSELSDD